MGTSHRSGLARIGVSLGMAWPARVRLVQRDAVRRVDIAWTVLRIAGAWVGTSHVMDWLGVACALGRVG